ncbi:MAG: alanine--tRNA ligase [Eggerthellaceae bacterium]|jgi:alanyl-tRNA synthetase|nr:alanine--tRNA ligase [Eggerthellaceae bacterium]MCH4221022.1 alanine--tRNA ligase [Eggerthellaceae bacterium]
MHYMTTAEIREKYLRFFEEKGCKRMASSSLVPDDPSLLLTSAGMVQFKPYFLQQKHLDAPFIGATTAQKCVRTNDIDLIGTDGRHLSFFEMMGNFSFGAYFKKEMCAWALEFSTKVLELPIERLYFTVFEDDDETIEIWKDLGVAEDHISRMGEEDNFWRAGPTGPCGPCSELYYDQGVEVGCGDPDCAPGCDCDRFLEYWNCVFTQYDAQEDGSLVPLPKKNIDTGMGLERIAAIMQGVQSNFDTDVLRGLVAVGEKLSGRAYGSDDAVDKSLRIMADHTRSVAFMVADGILPSNEGRGYVLRRLIRRAVMKGHLLGIEGSFLGHYIEEIVKVMGDQYHELQENRELIDRVVDSEEARFGATLHQGRAYLSQALDEMDGTVLSGETAFTLHDTYGFPFEVTADICAEEQVTVDKAAFDRCMDQQRDRARRATAHDADAAWSTYDGSMSAILEAVGATEFIGYDHDDADVCVRALLHDGERVDVLNAGEAGGVICDKTPFYAEMGGEIGDIGTMMGSDAQLTVTDTKAPEKGLVVHHVTVTSGAIHVGDGVRAIVDAPRRARIRRNHSATHILHWALRQVLGDHVRQAGSYVAPDRLRFDFTHFESVTRDQICAVEGLANRKIMENHTVTTYETGLDEARASGVTALFGEKYGDRVRVVDMDGFSRELCGGMHVAQTSEIGLIKITSESSVGANVRRIEAVTSFDALAYVNRIETELRNTADVLRVPLFDVDERTAASLDQLKDLQTKMKRNKRVAVAGDLARVLDKVTFTAHDGYPIVIMRSDGVDAGGLRNLWDIIRPRLTSAGACVLAGDNNGTPLIMAAGSDEAVAAGFHAGSIIKSISSCIKGGGGGKPTMAQAGGKSVEGIDAALEQAKKMLL